MKAGTSGEVLCKLSLRKKLGRTLPLEKRGETETITDKHPLKFTEKVSRNSREEKLIQNYDGDFSTFGQLAQKGRFAYFVAPDKVSATAA